MQGDYVSTNTLTSRECLLMAVAHPSSIPFLFFTTLSRRLHDQLAGPQPNDQTSDQSLCLY